MFFIAEETGNIMPSSQAFDEIVTNFLKKHHNGLFCVGKEIPKPKNPEEIYRLLKLYEINAKNILNLINIYYECLKYLKIILPDINLKYLFLDPVTINHVVDLMRACESDNFYIATELEVYHYGILLNSTNHLYEWAKYYGFYDPFPTPELKMPIPPECRISKEDTGFNIVTAITLVTIPTTILGLLWFLALFIR